MRFHPLWFTMAVAPVLLADQQPAARLPAPVIDMHLHALAANAQGPPPLGLCSQSTFPVWDQRQPWGDTFIAVLKKPACADPVWSPKTDDELRQQTLDVLKRRNIIGLTAGTPARVARWRQDALDRLIPAVAFQIGPTAPAPEALRELHGKGQFAALSEVTNQYAGSTADDPAFEPTLALAEELDVPVGIHVGPGPPGAPYLFPRYRARMHSALALEEPLVKHPKLRVFVMHAGWPMIDDLLAVLWAHPQVHVEVGMIVWGLPPAEFYRYLQRIVDAGFAGRVMFGSDHMVWPGMLERAVRTIEDAPFLSEQQKRDILYNNAARFLRLSQAEMDRHHGR